MRNPDERPPPYLDVLGDENPDELDRDRIPIRSMVADDFAALVRIDRRITGLDRTAYFTHKVSEALEESGIRISVVAEDDGSVMGFIMARLDYGEFGHTEPEAVIDTIGVDPGYAHHHVGYALMSQLLTNLTALRVDRVRTEVDWNRFDLIAFLEHCGFAPTQRLAFSLPLD